MSTPPAAPAPPRRRWRRVAVPVVLLVLLLATGVVLFVRGTWADTQPRDPADVAAGPVAQVYQPPGESKRVRCAILLPAPPERVRGVVTDYKHYGDLLPYLADVSAEPAADGWHMTGQARSVLGGYWPFAIDVHEKAEGGRFVAWWDQTGTVEVRVNRGSWEVAPAGPGQTLLVLSLEGEVHNYPTFILRNVFLHRLKEVLRRVAQQVKAVPGQGG
jgi:hypothetical protein